MGEAYGKTAQIITGLLSVLVCAGILGAQVAAIGYVVQVFLGFPYYIGILFGCMVVVFYSTFGGMRAVILTDVVQFIILSIGMPVLVVFGIQQNGGLESFIVNIPAKNLNILNGMTLTAFSSLFLTFLIGETLVPPYVQRLLIGKDPAVTAKATVISGLYSIPYFIISGLVGLIALASGYRGEADESACRACCTKITVRLPGEGGDVQPVTKPAE